MKKNIQIMAVMVGLMVAVPVTFAEVEKPTVKMIETSAKTDFAWADLKVSAVERDEAWDELQKVFAQDATVADMVKKLEISEVNYQELVKDHEALQSEHDLLLQRSKGGAVDASASAKASNTNDEAPSREVMLHKNVRYDGKRWPAGETATLPDSVLESLAEGTYSEMDKDADTDLVEI